MFMSPKNYIVIRTDLFNYKVDWIKIVKVHIFIQFTVFCVLFNILKIRLLLIETSNYKMKLYLSSYFQYHV